MTTDLCTALTTSPIRELFIGSVIGRSSSAMISLGIVLLIYEDVGSFALAGIAAGTFAICSVAAGPIRSWLTVLCGHRLTLLSLGTAEALTLVVLTAAVMRAWSSWIVITTVAMVGAVTPPFGALMRVAWSQTLPEKIHPRAFGLDSVCEEVTLMAGPLLIGMVLTVANPQTCLPVSGALCVLGAVTMAFGAPTNRISASSRPGAVSVGATVRRAAPVFLTLSAIGLTVGAVEVGVPALAEKFHALALAGPLLAILSAASAGGAFVYGRRTHRIPLEKRVLLLSASAAVGTSFLAAAIDLVILVPLLLFAGLAIGPAIMSGYLMADRTMDGHAGKTHAAILASAACNAGTATGAALSGLLINSLGVQLALVAIAVTAVLLTGISSQLSLAYTPGAVVDP